MTIYYWTNFSKRKNSTKRPSGTGTSKTVVLKEGTSIERPTFVFSSNDFTINYIQAFGHYYFVDDIKSVRNDLIEVSCSMDVLATFKTEIGSYTAFIERCASNYDIYIPDPFVSIHNSETVIAATTDVSTVFQSTGMFVISVLNNKGSGAGFTTYYAIDGLSLMQLAQYVNTDWGGAIAPGGTLIDAFNNIVSWLQATFLKTADCIIDCRWIALNSTIYTSNLEINEEVIKIGVDNVYVGGSGVLAGRFRGTPVDEYSFTVSIPQTYSDFRRTSPYTYHKLFIPGYGVVDINALDFNGSVTAMFDIDLITGDVACYLKNTSGKVISTYTYNISVNCPVGKVGADVTGVLNGMLTTASGIAGASMLKGFGSVATGLMAASGAINTIASAAAPTSSIKGNQGGRALMRSGLDLICTSIAKSTSDPDDLIINQGRMRMKKLQISTLSGYVKCSNASVPIAGMSSEKDAVNDYLNSGFYYE